MAVDLPNELLVDIFQYLDPADLLNAANSCHRLNPVAVAIFMQKTGSPDPQMSCAILAPIRVGAADILAALTLNLSIDSIEKFFCILKQERNWPHTSSNSASYIADLTWNIKRVSRLISRLSWIGSMSLVIDAPGIIWFLQSSEVQRCLFAILRLVETAILKGCTSFQISLPNQDVFPHGNSQLINRFKGSKMETFWRFMTKHQYYTPRLQGSGWWAISSSRFPSRSKLTSLDLTCPCLLLPPLSKWTLGVMKSSPITSLTLRLPTKMSEEDLHHYLFPDIAASVPGLQEIKLDPRVEFLPTVIRSLHLLPLLRAINFGLTSFSVMPITLPTTDIGLLHLTSFTGSSDQAAYLFGRPGFSCPKLEFVNIIIDMSYHHRYDFRVFAHHFTIFNTRFSEMGIAPYISACITERFHSKEIVSTAEDRERFQESFKTVSRLTFQFAFQCDFVFRPSLPSGVEMQCRVIYSVLDIFCGLQSLTLVEDYTCLERLAPDAAILASISAKYPDIPTINMVDLPANPEKSHYHWPNRDHDSYGCTICRRGWHDGIPTKPLYDRKPLENCACSDF